MFSESYNPMDATSCTGIVESGIVVTVRVIAARHLTRLDKLR